MMIILIQKKKNHRTLEELSEYIKRKKIREKKEEENKEYEKKKKIHREQFPRSLLHTA